MCKEIRQCTDYSYHGYNKFDGEYYNKINGKIDGMRLSFSWFTNHIYVDYFKDNELIELLTKLQFSNKKVGSVENYEFYL